MENFNGEMLMDLKTLRMLNEAQIATLAQRGDSDDLFRAQVVGKILEDDNCFAEMNRDEAVDVLVALGFKPEAARRQVEHLWRQAAGSTKKLSHMKK